MPCCLVGSCTTACSEQAHSMPCLAVDRIFTLIRSQAYVTCALTPDTTVGAARSAALPLPLRNMSPPVQVHRKNGSVSRPATLYSLHSLPCNPGPLHVHGTNWHKAEG